MLDVDNLLEAAEAWCQSYVAAFEAYDLEGIGSHWAFPAMVVSGEHQLMMKEVAAFDRNTGALIDFYKRQNARRVVRKVQAVFPMAHASVAMRVHDTISTPDGEPITEWISAYILKKTSKGWKAIFADATGEAAAWVANGTPLGT